MKSEEDEDSKAKNSGSSISAPFANGGVCSPSIEPARGEAGSPVLNIHLLSKILSFFWLPATWKRNKGPARTFESHLNCPFTDAEWHRRDKPDDSAQLSAVVRLILPLISGRSGAATRADMHACLFVFIPDAPSPALSPHPHPFKGSLTQTRHPLCA